MTGVQAEPAPTSTKLVVAPVSGVVATRNRPAALERMLASLAEQSCQPAELVIVDASDDEGTFDLCSRPPRGLAARIEYCKAATRGAAAQRNESIGRLMQPIVWFVDDDVTFEPECVARLFEALEHDAQLGGVNAMIVNQRYYAPGRLSRAVFRLLDGRSAATRAGRVIGPAVNLLPEDSPALPEVVPVEWLNTTCTMYRREALPEPPFDGHFTGYSLMEDLTLSLRVGKSWKLANARTARIYHDSQPGEHKADVAALAEMELVNRHYIMTQVLGRRRLRDYAKLGLWEAFSLASQLRTGAGRRLLGKTLLGKLRGAGAIVRRPASQNPAAKS